MRIAIADPSLMPQRSAFEDALPDAAVTSWHEGWNEHAVLADLKDADVYVGPGFIDAMGAEARSLRLVHVAGAGYDGIDAVALPAGAECANTFHQESSIAEHVATVLVALCRNLLGQDAALRTGVWSSSVYSADIHQPETLRGAVVTFLGFGHIGGAARKLLQSFGAEGIAITRSGSGEPSALPFGRLDNIVMTPHSTGVTAETFRGRAREIADNITRLSKNEPMKNVVISR